MARIHSTSIVLVLLALAGIATASTGGGVVVVKSGDSTLVDNGAVVCDGLTGDGVGGGCLPIPTDGRSEPYVGVVDDVSGAAVAFQVCIDNNGDGICGGPVSDPKCADDIFFSHSDGGRFFNALGPLPTTRSACPSAFQGYVVLLCTGVHDDRAAGPHEHAVTNAMIFAATTGSGFGDFCGGSNGGAAPSPTVAKAYRVV